MSNSILGKGKHVENMSHFIACRKYVDFIYWSEKCPSEKCPSKKRPGAETSLNDFKL